MSEQDTSSHVLVLSDAEDIRQILQDLLEDEGYRVTTQAYLTGAIDAVASQTPDAILIDCNRMELDESVTFLGEIRSYAHLRDIPIVACTSAVRMIEAYQPTIQELDIQVIRKPFDIDILAGVIAESLALRHRAPS